MRALVVAASFLGLSLTIIGAMGAHLLAADESGLRSSWDSAMLFGFVHVLAAVATAALPFGRGFRLASGWTFIAGVVLFSLTILARTAMRLTAETAGADPLASIGMLAPAGGFAFMAGWLLLGISALLAKKSEDPA